MRAGRDLTLATKRLVLEPLGPQHADDMWRAIAVSLGELRPWLMWAGDADPVQVAAFAETAPGLWDAGSDWVFALVHDGDVVGTVGLHRYDAQVQAAELGYWVSSEVAGQGLMTEAAEAVIDFAWTQLELHRIELHAAPANEASVGVAEKLGFTREGLLRDGSRGADGWHDVYVFGLLASDRLGRMGTDHPS